MSMNYWNAAPEAPRFAGQLAALFTFVLLLAALAGGIWLLSRSLSALPGQPKSALDQALSAVIELPAPITASALPPG